MTANHLHSVDNQSEPAAPASSSGGGGGIGVEHRLARLEARVEYLTTKEDIQKVKVWVLVGVLGGMGIAATLAVGILKLFF